MTTPDSGIRPRRLAYFFWTFPLLSQQFLQREVAGVAACGLEIEVHSLWAGKVQEGYVPPPGVVLHYFRSFHLFGLLWALPRELWQNPWLVLRAWHWGRRHPPKSLEHWRQTGVAVVFALCRAAHFRRHPVDHFHGAWATGPATAAALLSHFCNRPYSFGAHAYDVYRDGGDPFLASKMQGAAFVHTTTDETLKHLRQLALPTRPRIVLARRGLLTLPELRVQRSVAGPVRLLTVARLVAKKGISHQLAAVRALERQGISWEWKIIGDGPLRGSLQEEMQRAQWADRVQLRGAQPPEQVRAAYEWADILWHTGVVDPQGDRDGLPNVIPEAMAHGVAVISCPAPGATEAIQDGVTGLVVDVIDAEALAGAVIRLTKDAGLRERLALAGRRWVEENFLAEKNSRILAEAFEGGTA